MTKEEIVIGGQKFPKQCPEDCKGKQEAFYQGCTCHRCPIFNCANDDPMARLIEPEDYRPDWAKEYKKWFNSDFNGWPELYLYPKQ